jgi:hemolysin III
MPLDASAARYTPREEIANSITHGVGIVLSIAGLATLTAFASLTGSLWHIVSCVIFGTTLILLYTASTLYHGLQTPRAKRVMRRLDHSAIFLLIAGTYTPFTLVSLRGAWGWALFGVIWGLAAIGILFQTTLLHRWVAASILLYVGMGWAVVVAIKPMLAAVAPGGLILLLLGGLAYTSGIGFYVRRKMRYHHAIWHGFVLAGSTLHFFAVLFYVIP